ncbi:MAG: LysR family transcriptional regulator, partial [Alphaproteobacteria bacterium]
DVEKLSLKLMHIRPRRPKGPHLNSLRAFEAAARLESFTAAAEELSVTPGAITQHIKSLESWAEVRLFVRHPKGVKLTSMAEELLPGFIQAFDQLGNSVQALRNKATPQKVTVAALPSIAQLWLAPRLGLLRRSAPEISVSVVAMETPPNTLREPFDMTFFYSTEAVGPDDICIVRDKIFPVCSPAVSARITNISDLSNETLLYDSVWGNDWGLWLSHQQDASKIVRTGIMHSLFSVALEEAINDGGVLIAHEALVQQHLDKQILVRPFKEVVDLPQKLVAKITPSFRHSDTFEQMQPIICSHIGPKLSQSDFES